MILCTINRYDAFFAVQRLQKLRIDYAVQCLNNGQVNLFFGKKECMEVVRQMIHKPLNQLTPEEDFILGIMLGYDICRQCQRYCSRKDFFRTV